MQDLREHYPKGLYALRNLSHVPRWSIVAITQQQSVADHSFQALALFKILAKLTSLSSSDKLWGYEWLIHHDVDESLTGDMPSVCKDENWEKIEEKVKAEIHRSCPHFNHEAHEGTGIPEGRYVVLSLCTLADSMEAYLKCFDEIMSGNRFAYGAYEHNQNKILRLLASIKEEMGVRAEATMNFVWELVGECDQMVQ